MSIESADADTKGGEAALSVLIAEDDRVNQIVAQKLLEKAGIKVSMANDGREAVELYKAEIFDVVLMDLEMPVMDGWEAVAEIRKYEKKSGRRTRILAMTAHADKGLLRSCLDAGMDGHVAKPVSKLELLEKLAEVKSGK